MCVCGIDIEVGLDASHCSIVDQHLSADHQRRQKQRPVAVHDSTILTTCLRPSHAGNNC